MHVIYTLIFGRRNAVSSIYGPKDEYWFWKRCSWPLM